MADSFFDQVGIEQPEYCDPLLNRSVRQVTVAALKTGKICTDMGARDGLDRELLGREKVEKDLKSARILTGTKMRSLLGSAKPLISLIPRYEILSRKRKTYLRFWVVTQIALCMP